MNIAIKNKLIFHIISGLLIVLIHNLKGAIMNKNVQIQDGGFL